MSAQDNGGPAFPPMHDPNTHVFGMTLRDYFAAKAPAELIDVEVWSLDECCQMLGLPEGGYDWRLHHPMLVAKLAYRWADAMLKERQS